MQMVRAVLSLAVLAAVAACQGGQADGSSAPDARPTVYWPERTDGCPRAPPTGGSCTESQEFKVCDYTESCPTTLYRYTCKFFLEQKGYVWAFSTDTCPDASPSGECPSTPMSGGACLQVGKRCTYREKCPDVGVDLVCEAAGDASRWRAYEAACTGD